MTYSRPPISWFWNTGETVRGTDANPLYGELFNVYYLWSHGKLRLDPGASLHLPSSRGALCHTIFIVRKDAGLSHRDWERNRKWGEGQLNKERRLFLFKGILFGSLMWMLSQRCYLAWATRARGLRLNLMWRVYLLPKWTWTSQCLPSCLWIQMELQVPWTPHPDPHLKTTKLTELTQTSWLCFLKKTLLYEHLL